MTGRRSFGTRTKRLIEEWLATRTDDQLVRANFGQQPSLADIVKMVHPKPATESRSALYASIIGREHDRDALPGLARELAEFRDGARTELPDVPLPILSGFSLTREHWIDIARRAPYQTTRMQLNTFLRNGVFKDESMVKLIAERLRDREKIVRSGVQPHQLLIGAQSLSAEMPSPIRLALEEALEIAVETVPAWPGKLAICVDVSGSMTWPLTGARKGATSSVRCIDAAALITAIALRRSPGATVVPFEQSVVDVKLRGRDSIASTAERLASVGGGGTNCSAAMRHLVEKKSDAELVVFVSDNQSWVDARRGESGLLREWRRHLHRVPHAKLVCLDLQPYTDTPAVDAENIRNFGGFSDAVFERIDEFARSDGDPATWVATIEAIEV